MKFIWRILATWYNGNADLGYKDDDASESELSGKAREAGVDHRQLLFGR